MLAVFEFPPHGLQVEDVRGGGGVRVELDEVPLGRHEEVVVGVEKGARVARDEFLVDTRRVAVVVRRVAHDLVQLLLDAVHHLIMRCSKVRKVMKDIQIKSTKKSSRKVR